MTEEIQIKIKTVFNINRLIETLISIGFISLSLLLLEFQLTKEFEFGIYLIIIGLFFLGMIPISLMLNYLRQGLKQTIRFDYDKEFIHVQKGYQSFHLNFDEIEWVEVYEFPNNLGRLHFDYYYWKYFLKNDQILISQTLKTH